MSSICKMINALLKNYYTTLVQINILFIINYMTTPFPPPLQVYKK